MPRRDAVAPLHASSRSLRQTLDAMKESAKPVYDTAYFAPPAAPKPEAAKEPAKPETKKQ